MGFAPGARAVVAAGENHAAGDLVGDGAGNITRIAALDDVLGGIRRYKGEALHVEVEAQDFEARAAKAAEGDGDGGLAEDISHVVNINGVFGADNCRRGENASKG